MHPFKKMIFSLSLSQTVVATRTTELALRSDAGYLTTTEINICVQPLNTNCKIMAQNLGQITSGDIMYEQDGVTPFNGGASVGASQAYYNVVLLDWAQFDGTRVCLISSNGVITVDTICAS